jgi:hypothetical protein
MLLAVFSRRSPYGRSPAEATCTQVQVAFIEALEAEGILERIEATADVNVDRPWTTPRFRCCSRSPTTARG